MVYHKTKKIGIDLDDVVLDFNNTLMPYHNKKFGTNYQRDDITSFELMELWKCTRKEVLRRIDEFYQSEEHRHAEPVLGVRSALNLLASKYELHIVTSKPELLRLMTEEWLDCNIGQVIHKVHFTNQHTDLFRKTKGEFCSDFGIEYFIEDSLEYAVNVASWGIPVCLYDVPWNQGIVKYPIKRVFSWMEILDILV